MESAKRRVLITKIQNEKGEVVTLRNGIANVFGEFSTKNKKKLNKKTERMKMRAASMCITTTPMR